MYCKSIITTCITLLIVYIGIVTADVSGGDSNIKTKLVGMGSIEAGQLEKCEINGGDDVTDHLWYQKVYMHVGFLSEINERTKLSLVGEGMVHYAAHWDPKISNVNVDDNRPIFSFYPHDVSISYSFGNVEKPWLKIGAGIFPFKYNPDVRNLGEYLFRTNTYPPTMRNTFDFPMGRVTGFQISSTPVDSLNIHAMITSESQVLPLMDWGPAFLADYTVLKTFTVGAGVFYSHLWSVNEKYTTPKLAVMKTDSAGQPIDYYTFRGTKLMGRLALDLKSFLPFRDIFGANDLRIYSEVAFLGLENQGTIYDKLWRRKPIMLGVNFPAFKLLDVLSIELEWYKWNYRNSYSTYLFAGMLPLPDNDKPVPDWGDNYLKWSFYAKKTIGKNFSIVGQIAYDHMQYELNVYQQTQSYFGDAMHKHGDWAWVLKTEWDY